MFEGCSNLTIAPELPATILAEGCYRSMFFGCRRLTSAPELPAATLAAGCYQSMFCGCENLTSAPELRATTLAFYCYQSMFSECTSLASAPYNLPATTLEVGCYQSMFSNCTSLASAPELHATTLALNCYLSMFSNCTSLTSAPELHATTLAEGCYSEMFSGCTSLTTAPYLPATTLEYYCYSRMFSNCRRLTSSPVLHATTLAEGCYESMFSNCTSLESSPVLPAETLEYNCYESMFSGCTSLTTVTCLATDINADDATYDWLYDVAETGTFIKAKSMTDWETVDEENGIPEGWKILDYEVTLAENADNTTSLTDYDGQEHSVTLTRTLQAGSYNTFAVPFNISSEKLTQLGITAKELTSSSYAGGTLTLNFADASSIKAGKPYLVKVNADVEDPTFNGVTVSSTPVTTETDAVDFIPTLGLTTITGDTKSILFLGANNTLLYPNAENSQMKGFRAYFRLKGDAAAARDFRLDFGDGEAASISEANEASATATGCYTLDGRRLQSQPSQKGLYIVNGKKVIVK